MYTLVTIHLAFNNNLKYLKRNQYYYNSGCCQTFYVIRMGLIFPLEGDFEILPLGGKNGVCPVITGRKMRLLIIRCRKDHNGYLFISIKSTVI